MVECQLPKLKVASSILVARFKKFRHLVVLVKFSILQAFRINK